MQGRLQEEIVQTASFLQPLFILNLSKTLIIHTIIHILRILKIHLWESILNSLRQEWINSNNKLGQVAAEFQSI